MVTKVCPECGSKHYKGSRLLDHYIKNHCKSRNDFEKFVQWLYLTYFPDENPPNSEGAMR